MPVYNKRGILLLPKVIVLNPKDGKMMTMDIVILYAKMVRQMELVRCLYMMANLMNKKE